MKHFKRILSASLASVMLIGASAVAFNADSYLTLDGYAYTYGSDTSTAIIHKYVGTDTEVTVPRTIAGAYVTTMEDSAFFGNKEITSVDFSKANLLKTVGSSVFYNCTSLETVYIPTSVSSLGTSTFQNCKSLKNITLNAMISSIPAQTFYNCDSLATFDIPSRITSIESFAFANCDTLGTVTIMSNVTSIATNAFKNSPNVVIRCYRNSYAHQYAVDNNINYELIDPYELGDVNRDGEISIADATLIQKYLVGNSELDNEQLALADTNKDGNVDISDATLIQKFLVGMVDEI